MHGKIEKPKKMLMNHKTRKNETFFYFPIVEQCLFAGITNFGKLVFRLLLFGFAIFVLCRFCVILFFVLIQF